LGARGLRSLCESIFTDAMFEMPSSDQKELHVDKSYAAKQLSCILLDQLKAAS
jgi:ATP-dependent Clp protease ATP-binding subunit ClpX